MKRLSVLTLLAFLALGCEQATEVGERQGSLTESEPELAAGSHRVLVAPPTGDPAVDIPNIETAIAAAGPGDVIKFRKGEYAIDEDGGNHQFVVSTPGVTLRGHWHGTTIRGVPGFAPAFGGSFLLNGGNQAVRNITFEGFTTAITIAGSSG